MLKQCSSRAKRLYSVMILASLTLMSACGGDGSSTPTGQTGSVSVSLGSSNTSLIAGSENATAVINVNRAGGYTGTVNISIEGVPAGVTVTASPSSLGAGVSSSTLNIQTSPTAAIGSHTITVRVTGEGISAASTTYSLTILPVPEPSYSISTVSDTVRITQGTTKSVTVNIDRLNGHNKGVRLGLTGTPSFTGAVFTPSITTANSSVLEIITQIYTPYGTYPFVITATDTDSVKHNKTIYVVIDGGPALGELNFSQSAISVIQGNQVDLGIKINRSAGVSGPITFSLDNEQPYIQSSFSPNPVAGDSTTLRLAVSNNHPSGGIYLRIRAMHGDHSKLDSILITTHTYIPHNFSIRTEQNITSVTAGANVNMPISILRTGEYDKNVSFSVSGAPSGMTAEVNPSPTTGHDATLQITTSSLTVPGSYTLNISATGEDIDGTRNASLVVSVNQPEGGVNVSWKFCEQTRVPLWFAWREDDSQAWKRVAPTSGTNFTFPMSKAGQIAYVNSGGSGGYDISVFNVTPQEALETGAAECEAEPPRKTVHGTIANPLPNTVLISMGGSMVMVPPMQTSFTIDGVADGVTDLYAIRANINFGGNISPLDAILRRNINPTAGSTMPALDFSSDEVFPSASVRRNYTNTNGEAFITTTTLMTENGVVGTFQTDFLSGTETQRSVQGLRSHIVRPGDLHFVLATTMNPVAPRQTLRYNNDIFSGGGTTEFGPLLNEPTVTRIAGAHTRLRASLAWQAEYNTSAAVSFTQSVLNDSRSVTISGSNAFFTGSNFTFEIPDFSGADGWNSDWMLKAGRNTEYSVSAAGFQSQVQKPTDGTSMRTAQRIGNIVP